MSVPLMVTSAIWPASTWSMNSLNFSGVSFFWIWAKCQARKMTTSRDIHSMIVLNVAFTVQASRARGARLAPAAGDGDLAALGRGRRPRDRPEVRQAPVSLGVVQAVADDEATVLEGLVRGKGGPVGVDVDLAVPRLVDERADLQAARAPLADVVEEEAQGDAGIDDVVEEQDVPPLVGDLGGVHDRGAHGARALLAQRRRLDEVAREIERDPAHEVGHEDETALHQTDHAGLAAREDLADLPPQLIHPAGDLLFVVEDFGLGQLHRASAPCSSRRT